MKPRGHILFATLMAAALLFGQTGSLRDLGEKNGIRIGTAVDPRALKNEPAYAQTLAREFSRVESEGRQ